LKRSGNHVLWDAPSLPPLFGIKQEEKTKFLSQPISFLANFELGKICPSILNLYQKYAANYFGFGIILNVREGYPKFTIKSRNNIKDKYDRR